MFLKKVSLFSSLFLFANQLCFAAQPFDWSTILSTPPGTEQTKGSQILHFKASNKPYNKDEEAKAFVRKHLRPAIPWDSDAGVLKYASNHVKLDGLYIELGVCTGKTINFIAALNPHQKIYGFDSFEGLSEDWIRGDMNMPAGTFAYKNPDSLPPVLHNVELIKGWFHETLPDFVKKIDKEKPIAFLHVDCCLYSSTATALEVLGPKIKPGTIIVFDELYNYPGYQNHEYKAFNEFLERFNLDARYLAYNAEHEQVVVEIIKKW